MELVGGLNAPIGRMGGKRRLADRLIKNFPDDYKTYVEPFVGAGNIFFRLEQKEGVKYIINDKDPAIISILRGLKTDAEHINTTVNRDISREDFNVLRNKKHKTAVDYIILAKSSFFSSGRCWQKKRKAGKPIIQTDFTKYTEPLKNTTILNEDFARVIAKYNKPTTFYYLDPPYENPKQTDYDDYCTPEQVADAVKTIKGKFMLSYNDSPNIRHLFSQYHIASIQTIYSPTTTVESRVVNEVVITNYPIGRLEKIGEGKFKECFDKLRGKHTAVVHPVVEDVVQPPPPVETMPEWESPEDSQDRLRTNALKLLQKAYSATGVGLTSDSLQGFRQKFIRFIGGLETTVSLRRGLATDTLTQYLISPQLDEQFFHNLYNVYNVNHTLGNCALRYTQWIYNRLPNDSIRKQLLKELGFYYKSINDRR
jgi:DNA adenine methylase